MEDVIHSRIVRARLPVLLASIHPKTTSPSGGWRRADGGLSSQTIPDRTIGSRLRCCLPPHPHRVSHFEVRADRDTEDYRRRLLSKGPLRPPAHSCQPHGGVIVFHTRWVDARTFGRRCRVATFLRVNAHPELKSNNSCTRCRAKSEREKLRGTT